MDATTRTVTWSSSNTGVATVSATGEVKGVSEGTATITATISDTNSRAVYTSTNEVTVSPKAAGSGTTYVLTDTLEPGKSYLIASGNDGEVMLLSSEAGSASRSLLGVSATVEDGTITLTDADVEAKVLFECESDSTSDIGGLQLKNGTQYLYTDNNNGLRMDNKGDYRCWHYKAFDGDTDKHALWYIKERSSATATGVDGYTNAGNTYKYYLDYSSGSYFTDAHVNNDNTVKESNLPKIYLFSEAVPVTGLTVSPETKTIKVNETAKLTATIAPADASNKKVTWSNSNTSVATVDANGKIKGIAEGTATITATSDEGGYTATCEVTVSGILEVQYFVIMINDYALSNIVSSEMMSNSYNYEYHGLQTVTYSPSDAAPYSILWTLEEVDGVENGYYVKSYDGKYLSATYVSKGSGNNSGYNGTLTIGETLDVWVVNSGIENWQGDGSTLQSSNASTSSKALYLAVTPSNNNIDFFTVRSSSDSSVPRTSVLIEPSEIIEPVAVTGITVSPTSFEIEAGKSASLTANVIPTDAEDKTVEWTSSDESVATVDANGRVRGVSVGTATITATTNDGGYTASCEVTVTPSSAPGIGYVITIGNYALSTNPSSDVLVNSSNYYYRGLSGVEYTSTTQQTEDILWLIEPTEGGYYIMSQDGRYLNLFIMQPQTRLVVMPNSN